MNNQVNLSGTVYNLNYTTRSVAKLEELCGKTIGQILSMGEQDAAELISAKFIGQLIYCGLSDKLTLDQVYDVVPLNAITELSTTAFSVFTDQILPDSDKAPEDSTDDNTGEEKE